MKRNLIALLLLLVSCALAARFLRKPGENADWNRMSKHMENCLNVFWGTPNNAVQLKPGSDGNPEAWVTAFSPRGTSYQRERWNFALLRFVAARHSALQLGQLNVTNGTTGLRLQPWPVTQAGDSLKENRVGSSQAPDEAGSAELIRRQQQRRQDEKYGANQVLALVEVVSTPNLVQKALVNPSASREHIIIWLAHFKGVQPEAGTSTERILELPEA